MKMFRSWSQPKRMLITLLGILLALAFLAPQAMAAAPLPGIEGPGGVPHYFGPYGNWAFSPLPKGSISSVIRIESGGSGYTAAPTSPFWMLTAPVPAPRRRRL